MNMIQPAVVRHLESKDGGGAAITVRPLTPHMGAEIGGLDLGRLIRN